MIISEEAYLEHAGVKGMKWGVRRAQKREARRDREAQRHQSGRLTNWERVGVGAAGYVAWSLVATTLMKKTGNPLVSSIAGGAVGIKGGQILRNQMIKKGQTRVVDIKKKKTASGVDEAEAIRKVEAFINSNKKAG